MTFPSLSRIRNTTLLATLLLVAGPAISQVAPGFEDGSGEDLVTLDFADVELPVVIDTIARMTGQNFIYDDRVRGRVTIISPTPIPIDQAYAVFESVLQVKGFTTVQTPGGTIKVVPLREAKESSVETVQSSERPPNRDHFVTRLIPLRYIDAESIVNTLKPLVSKDAHMAPYAATNTVILTESASNIRRIIAILESIDIETYKEELTVIPIKHADAVTLAEQLSEIYGVEASQVGGTSAARRAANRRRSGSQPDAVGTKREPVRILTDERTNSLLVLAPRRKLDEVRQLVSRLDVPVIGGGRIHVYYLKNANAEELAETLSGLVDGGGTQASSGGAAGSGAAQVLRSTVASLAGGISVTADPAINALIIQASQEGYTTLVGVIEQLDIVRPQVLVEALIMEVTVTDAMSLGVSALYEYVNGDLALAFQTAAQGAISGFTAIIPPLPVGVDTSGNPANAFEGVAGRSTRGPDGTGDGSIIRGLISASASNGDISIISAPHILTSDNEQAEIRIGDNIPIVTSRVSSAAGNQLGQSTSVGVERQDIGVTLRVTPQITEGNTLRLEIFQEISNVNEALTKITGTASDVGVALSNRQVENTVVVADGETVVIGGLIDDAVSDTVTKVPWLGDIPVLGWAFKRTSKSLTKKNLLIFLTPHIIRSSADLEGQTIRKREEFRQNSGASMRDSDETVESELERMQEADRLGVPYFPGEGRTQLEAEIAGHIARYPPERVGEIDAARRAEEAEAAARAADDQPPRYYLEVAVFGDPEAAASVLTDLVDAGHDGTLESTEVSGSLLYEIVLGPYESLDDASAISEVVRQSHGLEPSILVKDPQKSEP
ncbi:MAG: type II secretion system secretin GspD [Myxococcales bacterium]|nr:type II secretion system secretin GspD [Myxococcales bacterium]